MGQGLSNAGSCTHPMASPNALTDQVKVDAKEEEGILVAELCFAASRGDVARTQQLLRQGVAANAVDYDRRTALHIAAAEGRKDIVELLLRARAEADAKDRWNYTPLDEAKRGGFMGVEQALLAGGASHRPSGRATSEGSLGQASDGTSVSKEDPHHPQVEGAMLLCCAAAAGALGLLQELKDGGADLNAADYDGRTAMHVAAAHGHVNIIKWLIAERADLNRQDSFGLTPLGEAMRLSQPDICKILLAMGAESENIKEMKLSADSGQWSILKSEVQMGKELARTFKSVIYHATWRGTSVVAKTTQILKATPSGALVQAAEEAREKDKAVQEVIHEIKLLSTLRHPDLVMFLGACFDHDTPFFLVEFMEGGDLQHHYLNQARKLGHAFHPPGATLMKWISGVARALCFLHGCARPIIHRDLKPMNLLLTGSGDLKVTDFGISKLMAPKTNKKSSSDEMVPIMSGGVGTWRYMAPEVVRYEQYTDRVDIYSFALILWFMCTGRDPFVEEYGPDAEKVLKDYIQGKEPRPKIGEAHCSPAVRHFIEDCWHVKPSMRPSAQECTQRLAAMVARDTSGGLTSLKTPLSVFFGRSRSPPKERRHADGAD